FFFFLYPAPYTLHPMKHLPIIAAAILSSGLFLVISGMGLGFIFMFLPTLPLFMLGLGKSPRQALIATLLSAAVISVSTDAAVGCLFLVFLGLPAWHIAREGLLHRPAGPASEFFPIGLIFMQLALWASALVALMTFYYSFQEGLPQLLSH